ncbi:hypothetical protein L2764_26640, partial [Shewanella surugensis]|nr:hypothetical protein [Shewanella surugensis]
YLQYQRTAQRIMSPVKCRPLKSDIMDPMRLFLMSVAQVANFATEPNSMIAKVLTEFMIDLAAAMARDDYETRRKRQAQGISKAKALGKYQGRQPDHELRENIRLLISEGKSWSQVQNLLKCSRSTIAKASKFAST